VHQLQRQYVCELFFFYFFPARVTHGKH
jgi:hypothetical protein